MNSERAAFAESQNVSRETLERLDRYAEMLGEWNQKFNLVAESTLPHIWTRHFLDSAQLKKFIPETAASIADMGAGAGFPGLVLAIIGSPHIHLIESTGKKANFLRAVIDELKLDAEVHQDRAENLKNLRADVVTARAMASLTELLSYAKPLMNNDSFCLFPKGRQADVELTEAAKYWKFKTERHASLSDPSGTVLVIRDVKIKNDAARKKPFRKK